MGVNRLPKTVTRQRRDCDLNPGPSAPESGTLTTRLPSHPNYLMKHQCQKATLRINGPTAMSLVSVSLCGTQCRISAERCVGCSIDRLRRRHDNSLHVLLRTIIVAAFRAVRKHRDIERLTLAGGRVRFEPERTGTPFLFFF